MPNDDYSQLLRHLEAVWQHIYLAYKECTDLRSSRRKEAFTTLTNQRSAGFHFEPPVSLMIVAVYSLFVAVHFHTNPSCFAACMMVMVVK